jgi:non-ribosomal peptide synthetase component E (peptide arylation enzyme)
MRGEIVNFIESIDFCSKAELLTKLRTMRENTVRLAPNDRRIVKAMLGVAIQQVFHAPEAELLNYKKQSEVLTHE